MNKHFRAKALICKYEGFNEKAYPDPETHGAPYTIGYGTQKYPDGSLVKSGHLCTPQKAAEYIDFEIIEISKKLKELDLVFDECMEDALISFVHSVGWQPFFYSDIIDCIASKNWYGVAREMSRWIFDSDYKVIGNLLDRRREEIDLFLQEIEDVPWSSTEVLLTAFRNYSAAPHQIEAIRYLEQNINPYLLAEFANGFDVRGNAFDEPLDDKWN